MKDDAANRVAALIERIGRLVSRESHAEGLQPVQWEALRYLAKANRFSRTAAAATAYLMPDDPPTIATGLDASGFVDMIHSVPREQ